MSMLTEFSRCRFFMIMDSRLQLAQGFDCHAFHQSLLVGYIMLTVLDTIIVTNSWYGRGSSVAIPHCWAVKKARHYAASVGLFAHYLLYQLLSRCHSLVYLPRCKRQHFFPYSIIRHHTSDFQYLSLFQKLWVCCACVLQILVELHFSVGPSTEPGAIIPRAKSLPQMSLLFAHLANLGYGISYRADNMLDNIGCCSEFSLLRVEGIHVHDANKQKHQRNKKQRNSNRFGMA